VTAGEDAVAPDAEPLWHGGGHGQPERRGPEVVAVRPQPDPGVLAAIVAALAEAWPRPQPDEAVAPRPSVWRFSGRWWMEPTVTRRQRPRPSRP